MTTPTPRPKDPRTFDPLVKEYPAFAFAADVRRYFRLVKVEGETEKMLFTSMWMTHAAAEWADAYVHAVDAVDDANERPKFTDFLDALCARFEPPVSKVQLLTDLDSTRQRAKEPVSEYATRLGHAVALVNRHAKSGAAIGDAEHARRFVAGLTPAVRNTFGLRHTDDLLLAEAIELAVKCEAHGAYFVLAPPAPAPVAEDPLARMDVDSVISRAVAALSQMYGNQRARRVPLTEEERRECIKNGWL